MVQTLANDHQIILHAASLPPQEKRNEETILDSRPYMGSLLISLRTPWQWANYTSPYLLVRDSCSTAELGGDSRAEFDGVLRAEFDGVSRADQPARV